MTKLFDDSAWQSVQKMFTNDVFKNILRSDNTLQGYVANLNASSDVIKGITTLGDAFDDITTPGNAFQDYLASINTYMATINAPSDAFKNIVRWSDTYTFKSVFDTDNALKSILSTINVFEDYANINNATLRYLRQLQTDLEHEPDQREILEHPETELLLPETLERIVIYSPSIILLEKLRAQHISLHDLTWRQFEEVVAELLTQDGYAVELGRGTKDGGVDIIAAKDIRGIGLMMSVWQAKKLAIGNKVGVSVIRELADTRNRFNASKGVIVTTTSLTRGALERIEQDRYLLHKKDGNDLNAWIQEGRQP